VITSTLHFWIKCLHKCVRAYSAYVRDSADIECLHKCVRAYSAYVRDFADIE